MPTVRACLFLIIEWPSAVAAFYKFHNGLQVNVKKDLTIKERTVTIRELPQKVHFRCLSNQSMKLRCQRRLFWGCNTQWVSSGK